MGIGIELEANHHAQIPGISIIFSFVFTQNYTGFISKGHMLVWLELLNL